MISRSDVDFMGHELVGESDTRTEIHHIYPTRWCRENASGEFKVLLSSDGDGPNYANSISNFLPI